MTPYYSEAGVTIYVGDSRDIAPTLGRFDAVVTDPPYGHGSKWSGGTWASDPMYADAMQWDAEKIPNDDLVALLGLAPLSIVWGGNYYTLPPSRCWLSWVKSSQMETMADFELAWTNFDQPSKMLREHRNADGKRWHPTQKPESVMRWSILQAPKPLQSIFDPFMGSGTTLVAAKRLGIQAVGVDVSEAYAAIAVQRLAQGALPLEMGA